MKNKRKQKTISDPPTSSNSSSKKRKSLDHMTKWGRNSSSSAANDAAILTIFHEISDEDDPQIASMEGICKLCEFIEIDPLEDIRILILLFKMGAKSKPAQITRDEWMAGCAKLNIVSIDSIKSLLPSLDPGFMDQMEFRELYKFCFQFNRHGTHKTLDKEIVVALVELTLKGRIPDSRISSFQEFLNTTKDTSYDRVTLDQWLSFFDFCLDCQDLTEYDEENSAWPVLIDDYVDFAISMKD